MKVLLQDLKGGKTFCEDAPVPTPAPQEVVIRSARTLVSAGTERMLVEFGRSNLLSKARQQPEKVRQVLDKVRTDGLVSTLAAVESKLGTPIPMGYCNAGVVVDVGRDVRDLACGDRVASNGNHAEFVCVPQNLCARVPDNVTDDDAVFTVLGAVALQGIRLIGPSLGECIVVTGLGLVGQLAVQLLSAHGCRVLGVDLDERKCELARECGAETVNPADGGDLDEAAASFSRGRGVDGVLLSAATRSSEPVRQAARICRKRGRIVLTGVTGLELARSDFYEKELTFQVSCSYGPGRYDPRYEEKGQDYPVGFVRWTEQRNFEAVLDMLAAKRLNPELLVSHRFSFEEAPKAYDLIGSDAWSLGILLQYASTQSAAVDRTIPVASSPPAGDLAVGILGAGSYATSVLLPALAMQPVVLKRVCSSGGVSAARAARRFSVGEATSDSDAVLNANDCNVVVIATRHDTHASYVAGALGAGKHVFVEKPLALNSAELTLVQEAVASAPGTPSLMVGFNRRFAPHVRRLKELLNARREPPAFVMTVNAGAIPADHWTQDPSTGGGRIVGEACHFVDLLRFLAGASIEEVCAAALSRTSNGAPPDTMCATLRFKNGALGTIHYLANGSTKFPKERLEVFCGGGIVQLDNFRDMRGFGWRGFNRMRLRRQDKGQTACVAAFVEALTNGEESPISLEELVEVHQATFEIAAACT